MIRRKMLSAMSLVMLAGGCSALLVSPTCTIQLRAQWSMSSPSNSSPRGSAKRPLEKQKVAVFGAGGYLGGVTFGFLQRASSLYGTGLGGVSSIRNICATAVSADALNRILSKNFILAFAGEDMMRLTNMQDVFSIQQRLEGFSAVVMGTEYLLEERPVTSNTYDTSPNSKTVEFYLDQPRTSGLGNEMFNEERQLSLFESTLEACGLARVKHVIVVETPQTANPKQYAEMLDEMQVPFTYLRVKGDLQNCPDHTYSKGLQHDLQLESFTFAPDYDKTKGYLRGSWIDDLGDKKQAAGVLYREDVAALVVQCLQSLDWATSRCLVVSSAGPLATTPAILKGRYDKEWCVNSGVLSDKLGAVQ